MSGPAKYCYRRSKRFDHTPDDVLEDGEFGRIEQGLAAERKHGFDFSHFWRQDRNHLRSIIVEPGGHNKAQRANIAGAQVRLVPPGVGDIRE